MSSSEGEARPPPPVRRSWARRYPPLVVIGLALILVLAVMPSALNQPQSDPTEVPEYAPVPPQDDQPSPLESSNLQALRLGESGGIIEEVPAPPPDLGTGANPTIYNCVAGRQTEDPLSPPCSPFFTGDNGGATYTGVTKDEVTILVYFDGSINETSATATYTEEEAPLQGTYCDVDAEPGSDENCFNDTETEHVFLRVTRGFARYFNFRYQTYGRHLHFWIYFSGATDGGGRRADAAENYAKLKPFAVVDEATFRGNNNAYIDAMARNGVLVFSSLQAQPREFYRDYDPLVWTFWPDIEQQVEHYAEFICKKVNPYPVSHAGPGIAAGQKRKYAFMHTTDRSWPGLHRFRDLVRPKLKACGVVPETEVTFPFAGYVVDTGGSPTYARLNVADMVSEEVTTILWFGGVEGKTSQAADEQKYYPEIFYAGDTNMESQNNGFLQNRNFWEHAALVSNMLREDSLENSAGYQAWREGDPNTPSDPDGFWAGLLYRDYFMPALGVQVAGPRLHPVTVAEGFRAIPTITSESPYLPACYFTQGNFCVQDASQWWWDPDGQAPGRSRPDGCYRLVDGGTRYVLGRWPDGDQVFVNGTADPCNGFNGGFQLLVRLPNPNEGN